MLKYRLHLLYPIVDAFILVESTCTFSGSPKPLFFEKYKAEFQAYLDKIVHIVVDDTPQEGIAWDREHFQRNAIERGFQRIGLQPNDIIQLSDVDEIPNPNILSLIRHVNLTAMYSLLQDMYYYNPTTRHHYPWTFAKLFPYSVYTSTFKNLQDVRGASPPMMIPNGGWHFSYFGSADFIANKIKKFSHQEFNTSDITNTSHIEESIKEVKDLFNRPIHHEHIPLDTNPNLPPDIHLLLEYLEHYKGVL